jgi:hypothetical protein
MSVIAYKYNPENNTIDVVADTQISDDDLKLNLKWIKLFESTYGTIYGCVGCSVACYELKSMVNLDLDRPCEILSKKYPENEFFEIMASGENVLYYKNGEQREYYFDTMPYFAIGTGSKYALGALSAGATVKEAVEIACKYDLYCSAPIQEITLIF